MKEQKTVFIASPAGIIEDTLNDVRKMGDCIILNCEKTMLIIAENGEVYMKTTVPKEIVFDEENVDEDENHAVCVELSNVMQVGNRNFIDVFNDLETAKVFQANATTMLKLQKVAAEYKKNKEKNK